MTFRDAFLAANPDDGEQLLAEARIRRDADRAVHEGMKLKKWLLLKWNQKLERDRLEFGKWRNNKSRFFWDKP